MSDTEDGDEKPVVDNENTTVVEDKPPSVWQRLTLKQLRWTAVAVVLVLTAAFGGLKTAHHVTPISLGQTYNAGALLVTPRSVSVTDHWVGLPRLAPECRYLVLRVTIQNTAHESVPFPLQGGFSGEVGHCAPHRPADPELFGLTGIANQFGATFRGKVSIAVPSIDAGFTDDYSVIWAVSRAELSHHPEMTIRIHKMSSFISTFVLAHRWVGDDDHFAELRISNLESS
ncbi:hypothetical protein A5658_15905 [Mycobacterium sp. 1245111.1]|uniref:hypothetical protein n=1 Tax=Mycobacterium sp. 1245111.1 TaxID=1834073 RepID=UPI0007FBEED3|nr:hypothetical protein [Mycobacterium sp. 1245111.1]OBK32521.1 hypothetical protein A5658_15905 [Mycobacterium sp. 1245111.1]